MVQNEKKNRLEDNTLWIEFYFISVKILKWKHFVCCSFRFYCVPAIHRNEFQKRKNTLIKIYLQTLMPFQNICSR